MSVVFSIRNKKSMFGYQKVMPAKDVLNLVEGVLTYSFEEAMLSRSLKDFPAMLCIAMERAVCQSSFAIWIKSMLISSSLQILQPLKIGDSF